MATEFLAECLVPIIVTMKLRVLIMVVLFNLHSCSKCAFFSDSIIIILPSNIELVLYRRISGFLVCHRQI